MCIEFGYTFAFNALPGEEIFVCLSVASKERKSLNHISIPMHTQIRFLVSPLSYLALFQAFDIEIWLYVLTLKSMLICIVEEFMVMWCHGGSGQGSLCPKYNQN